MFNASREPRIREAELLTDGRIRVTAQLYGRERLLTFFVPSTDLIEAPAENHAIDLDGAPEDATARMLVEMFAAMTDQAYRMGKIGDDVDELPFDPDERLVSSPCGFGMRLGLTR